MNGNSTPRRGVSLREPTTIALETLRTHKLRGPLAGCWACSGGYDLRVVFECTQHDGAEAILLLALGKHEEVY